MWEKCDGEGERWLLEHGRGHWAGRYLQSRARPRISVRSSCIRKNKQKPQCTAVSVPPVVACIYSPNVEVDCFNVRGGVLRQSEGEVADSHCKCQAAKSLAAQLLPLFQTLLGHFKSLTFDAAASVFGSGNARHRRCRSCLGCRRPAIQSMAHSMTHSVMHPMTHQ